MSSHNAQGSVVVITGGTSGIGFANARRLIEAGARAIVISGRKQEKLDKAVKELEGLGHGTVVRGLIADAYVWEAVVSLLQYTYDTFGQVDYVIVNAASAEYRPLVLDRIEKPDTSDAVRILDSVYYAIHAASPFLAKSPAKDRAIIITGSDAAFTGYDIVPNYAVAKAGLVSLTYAYSDRLRALGIRINLVAMGWVLTDLTDLLVSLGGLKEPDFISMEVITSAYLRLIEDSTKSGVVTRIPYPTSIPFDVQGETDHKMRMSYWEPFLAKLGTNEAVKGETS